MAAAPSSVLGGKDEEMESFISSLPTMNKGVLVGAASYNYEGHWLFKQMLEGILLARKIFNPEPNTVLLAAYPKCGTTWFTALLFATINRTRYDFVTHPLRNSSPHECVPWLEYYVNSDPTSVKVTPSMFPIFKTHIPYSLLPESLKSSTYPIVYVSRNPMDAFVSLWHFTNALRPKDQPLDINELYDMFCQGTTSAGSYWDNVLGYWKASLEQPNKVLFIKYEGMQAQPIHITKKLAKFVGCPFSEEEEQEGMIEKIIEFCSIKSLTSFKVNQDATSEIKLPGVSLVKNSFYRKGGVGGYKNYLTDEMINQIKEITNMKFEGSGLDVFA